MIFRSFFFILLLSLLVVPKLYSDELGNWPEEVSVSSGTVTIYQPQVESLTGNPEIKPSQQTKLWHACILVVAADDVINRLKKTDYHRNSVLQPGAVPCRLYGTL
ncbi:hypothetical protein UWK_01353 [Desulfocapsa sulfexigens DSM 10523]|uniref:Uncharacterized protein n=1 Tax=Desulfocapsa sulfexigens (strain DSM 10523 / SB164P1) TaxID=1167006 RepID=M1NDX7_DESSD|nr:hypothetical protein UWK_01353 [Desulfocapsa sulfexigens DSM 10523]